MPGVELAPVIELVPHRDPVLLLERLLDHDGESTIALVDIGGQSWLKRDDGSVAAWLAPEYMAQCVAAHEGMLARTENRLLERGFLIAVLGLELHCREFGPAERLRVRVGRFRGRAGLGVLSHRCTIHMDAGGRDGRLLAEGRLCVAVPRPSRSPATAS